MSSRPSPTKQVLVPITTLMKTLTSPYLCLSLAWPDPLTELTRHEDQPLVSHLAEAIDPRRPCDSLKAGKRSRQPCGQGAVP